ncbi:hypothetical protein FC95_GL001633 [Lentilactobacillus kefiri DSM 20587 = JCM 5818]|jgi:hypothetical protein|uniref:Uncharacterized protein n=2 Tax=Lentilactobacillus kefiri TaxID=33962 RepID=A0A8E1V0G3_LENKE|nr:hypothetical protein FD08_GL000403 [Lentilactobacillus parakefiri DSM 10551]KRM51408.1 hypothetical protein FC95_GL001633 [Lentilactobacillus kefiri DSM 20587 = JCM 5818]
MKGMTAMITGLILLIIFASLVFKISWLFIKMSAWLVFLLLGILIFSKLLIVGLIAAAIYGVYMLYQQAQVANYNNRH